jgi:hypothetical protein
MGKLICAAAFAFALLAASAAAAAAATPKTVICGQIKNGPKVTYTSQVSRKKLSGSTWTVFATGVPCGKAMKASPSILKWWAKAKIESFVQTSGFTCTKESDGRGSAGSSGCIYSGLSNIELIMTGPYTIAQLKQMFFIGG